MPTTGSGGCRGPTLLAPAIELARDGYPADEAFCRAIEVSAAVFERELGPAAAGWTSVYRPDGRAWRPGERVRLPALAATLERIADQGWAEPYEGATADRQAAGRWPRPARRSAGPTSRPTTSTWTEPIATDYRGVRVTGHPPNSSGFVALELLNILEIVRAAGRGFDRLGSPAASRRPGPLGAPRDRGLEAGDGRPRRPPDRSRAPSGAARGAPRQGLRPARSRRGSIPAGRRRRLPPACPRGGGTIWLGVVDGGGQRGQPDPEQLRRLRFGHRRSRHGHRLPEPGFLLRARRRPPERPRAVEADAPHADAGDALPGRPAVGDRRLDGRRRPAPGPRPGRLGARRRWCRCGHGGRRAALVRGAGRALRPARHGPDRAALRAGRAGRAGRARPPGRGRPSRSTEPWAIATRSSWWPAGRRPAARWRRRPTPAARACRRPGEPRRRAASARLYSAPRAALGGSRDVERRPELSVFERDRGRPRGDDRQARGRARRAGRQDRGRDDAGRSERSLVGLQVPHPGLRRACSMSRASPTTCTPSTSCATGPAPRRSCADPAAARGAPARGQPAAPRSCRSSARPAGGWPSTASAWSPRPRASASSSA